MSQFNVVSKSLLSKEELNEIRSDFQRISSMMWEISMFHTSNTVEAVSSLEGIKVWYLYRSGLKAPFFEGYVVGLQRTNITLVPLVPHIGLEDHFQAVSSVVPGKFKYFRGKISVGEDCNFVYEP